MSDYCRATEALREGHPEEPPDRKCYDCMEVLDDTNAKRHLELHAKDPDYCIVPDMYGCDDTAMCDYCMLSVATDEIEGLNYDKRMLREALDAKS